MSSSSSFFHFRRSHNCNKRSGQIDSRFRKQSEPPICIKFLMFCKRKKWEDSWVEFQAFWRSLICGRRKLHFVIQLWSNFEKCNAMFFQLLETSDKLEKRSTISIQEKTRKKISCGSNGISLSISNFRFLFFLIFLFWDNIFLEIYSEHVMRKSLHFLFPLFIWRFFNKRNKNFLFLQNTERKENENFYPFSHIPKKGYFENNSFFFLPSRMVNTSILKLQASPFGRLISMAIPLILWKDSHCMS